MTHIRPTTGLRILNTRPKAQAAGLTQALMSLGTTVIELPLLEITPTSHWRSTPLNLNQYEYAIFTSPNAVTYFFETMPTSSWPASLKIIAIGQGTAKTLSHYHLTATLCPKEAHSEGILALPELQNLMNTNILLIKGVGGLQRLPTTLRARGAHLKTCAVYRRQGVKTASSTLQLLWQEDAIDMIVITSATALQHLFKLVKHQAMLDWLTHMPFVVISDRIARALKQVKIKTMIVTSYDNLLNTIKDLTHERCNAQKT